MRNPAFFLLIVVVLIGARTAFAGCTAPEDETQTPCISCGNLEQNPARAHDLAWNEFLRNLTMQLELRAFGATLVHLTNPPHSSPGVLYYTVIIEDPQFEITNTDSYAEVLQLMRTWGVAFSYAGANPRAEWTWRQSMSTRIENAISRSVSTGSAPYILRLMDSQGNIVTGGSALQPRLTGEQELALAGPSDLHPDDQYANEACTTEDSRHEDDSPADTGSNGGGPDDYGYDYDEYDYSDYWEGWSNGYREIRPACRPDFSDPRGAGVICVI